jgi:hypothetical protein
LAVWFLRRFAGLAAVATALVVVSPASVGASGGATMFVHTATGGEVERGRLTLRGAGRRLTWVTNGTRTGRVPVTRLHRRLFPRSTPAATGMLQVAGRRAAFPLRLSRPSFKPARGRVSYRVRSLDGSIPRRFGAASLSILGDPAVMGGTSGGHDCSARLLNHALYDLAVVSTSTLQTDVWNPEIRAGTVIPALTGITDWQSDGGALLGCSNTVVLQFSATAGQPAAPTGTFTITTSYPWSSPFSNTCVPTNPSFVCRALIDEAGQAAWEIRIP